MTTAKLLFNLFISTPGARFIKLDFKNFYFKTPLPEARCMKMKIYILPDEIIKKYNMCDIIHNEYVYFKINMSM